MDDTQTAGTAEGPASSAEDEPMGLRGQLGAVRDAVKRLLTAHIDLAKSEFGEIGEEIGNVALLGGIAFGALVMLAFLLPIGGLLFLAEWLLGSIGWGVLLGSLALLDGAIVAVLLAMGVPRNGLARDYVVALVGAIVVTALLLLFLTGVRVGVGLGLTVLLIAWPILAGYGVARRGIDTEALKARFYPTQTIETTKETIEWVRERTPLGPKS